jgi:hypothetical protein
MKRNLKLLVLLFCLGALTLAALILTAPANRPECEGPSIPRSCVD